MQTNERKIMSKTLCPDCEEPVKKDDPECEACGEQVCEGCQEDHAMDETFPE